MSLKLDAIIELIVTKSGKPKEEVIQLIEAKRKELDGYVTDEGAASLVARELDLDLFEKQETSEIKIQVRDLVAGMSGVSLNLRVQRVFPVRTFTRKQGGEGKVANLLCSDPTGSIRLTMWSQHTKAIEDREIEEGDIIRVINCRVKTGLREQLELHLGVGSRVMLNPPDVDPTEFPEVSLKFTKIANLREGMGDVHVQGTIRAKFRKTTFSRGDGEGVVANLSIGDETGQTRLVLWDEQAEWFDKIEIDDMIRIESGYVRLDRNKVPELHVGRRGRITRHGAATVERSSTSPARTLSLKDVRAGDYVTAVGVVVVANHGIKTFVRKDGSEGKRLVLILADATGQVRAVAWGSAADELSDLTEGTLLRLENAGCRVGLQQELELHINKWTKVKRNPPGLEIESPSLEPIRTMSSESPSQLLSSVTQGNFVTIRGTIVQVFHQRSVYDACPKCSRKVTVDQSVISCPKCGEIPKSVPRIIAQIIIDDGTENMRARFIGVPAERLLGMSGAEAKALVEESGVDEEPIRRAEESLLGREIIVKGRIRLNNYSNELEIAVTSIEEPNAVSEASRLVEELDRGTQA